MRTEVIKVDTIDGAVERILRELKEDNDEGTGTPSRSRHNVIYFDGWDGLGASAVLREVGRRLTQKERPSAAGLEFSQVIHIDCSKWESRRAMQRALAEKLQLPAPVMMIFDTADEEEDYQGVGKGSRHEIPKVAREIFEHVQKQLGSRFLVIFNNGSCEEIDLENLGFPPLSGYSRNKALWTFQGGFRLYPRKKIDEALGSMRKTDVVLSAASHSSLSDILLHEAADAARKIDVGGINWPVAAANCFLYTMKLCAMSSHLVDYDLATHGSNYWKCDGIIQLLQGDHDCPDRLWLSGDALQHEMRLDVDYYKNPYLTPPLVMGSPEHRPYWASPTYGFILIPADQNGHIPKGMLQSFDGLCVLKLSACILSFASPPFLCCHSLRFLWLDHCRYESSEDDAGNEEDIRRCFQRLWVLDVRYSSPSFLSTKMMDYMTQLRELDVMGQDIQDMAALQERLHNIRKLRVTKSRVTGSRHRHRDDDTGILFSGKDKMELLDFSESNSLRSLYVVSSCSRLETVIIDGSLSLEKISLKGCAKLKNLLFSGLFPQLLSLDISGTAVKTLDLSAVAAPKLDELFLLDCGKLYVILWPSEDKRKRYLGKLHIDTTQTEGSTAAVTAAAEGRSPIKFCWYISTRDVRLLQSLAPVQYYFHLYSAHVEISTTLPPSPARRLHADASSGNKGDRMKGGSRQRAQAKMMQQLKVYTDVTATFTEDTGMHQQQAANAGDSDAWAIMSVCPPPPTRTAASSFSSEQTSRDCYMLIEDEMVRTSALQAAGHITIPGFICDGARILHVHHSLSSTNIFADPLGSSWNELKWCRAERCPKLECIFSPQFGAVPPQGSRQAIGIFKELKTVWASHLLNARYVLEYPAGSKGPMYRAFAGLTLLHLYCCPRLVYAIPLQVQTLSLENLETIEIMWCADLSVAFHLYEETSDQGWYGGGSWSFPNLKYIHLHELPRLRGIFNVPWECILAPKLEIIRIRGCWSLKALPAFTYKSDMVECDCEKEWWDRMQEHHRRVLAYHYKVTHPRYYKKTMLRGSVLR